MNEIMFSLIVALFGALMMVKKAKASDNETDDRTLNYFERISEVTGHVEGAFTQWLKLKPGGSTSFDFKCAAFFPATTIAESGFAVPEWAIERNGLVALLTMNDVAKESVCGEPMLLTQGRLVNDLVSKMRRAFDDGILRTVHDKNGGLAFLASDNETGVFTLRVRRQKTGGDRAPYLCDGFDLNIVTEP